MKFFSEPILEDYADEDEFENHTMPGKSLKTYGLRTTLTREEKIN